MNRPARAGPPAVQQEIARDELHEVLANARTERWQQLALLEPELYEDYSGALRRRGWPAPHIIRLREQLAAEDARALAALTDLTSLDLPGHSIGDEGSRALAALTNLTSLNVANNGIGADGARALATLTNLTSLNISGNSIGPEGARALLALTSLTWLGSARNGVGDEGARAVASLTNLTSLNL